MIEKPTANREKPRTLPRLQGCTRNVLSGNAADDQVLFVIDEFPYLADADPSIPSVILRFWDHDWKEKPVKIVLSGSDSCDSHVEKAEKEGLEVFVGSDELYSES